MKKLFSVFAFLLIVNVGFAQAKDSTKPAAPRTDSVTLSTPLLSVTDLADVMNLLQKKLTIEQLSVFQEINKLIDDKIRQRIAEFYAAKKK
jgi:hypothetical protein